MKPGKMIAGATGLLLVAAAALLWLIPRSPDTVPDIAVITIDGEQLAQYMIDFNIGVTHRTTYEVKKLDTSYFTGE